MLDVAGRADLWALEQLWLACFGGPQEYLDFYYGRRFVPEDTLVWREAGKPVSMMTLMKTEMDGKPGAYVYAVATLPEYRGRGLMRKVDSFAQEVIRKRGWKYSTLVPAERPLYAMYEKLGYHAEFFLWEGEVEAGYMPQYPVSICGAGEFFKLRREFLSRFAGAISHPPDELRYVYEELCRFSGAVYRVGDAYAACTVLENGQLLVRECSAEDPIPVAKAILHHLRLQTARIRSPYHFANAQRIPYGMGRLADGSNPLSAGFEGPFYMSLMLD